jgi:hypothetical protein
MGRAEELFLRIRSGGAAEIHAMISGAVVEELFLDYKQSSTTLPAAKLADADRRNLAKAIAGFGNSEGGVVIWGVDCRRTDEGDVPTTAVPIAQPIALKTLFDGAIGGLTLPPHSGVENLAVLNEAPARGGFVVTYIPVGSHVPYQTLVAKQEYYVRAGSNFLPVPHGVLAGLFGRAPQPNPVPIVRFGTVQKRDRMMVLRLDVSVVNKGRGFAEDIFCVVDAKWPRPSSVQYPYDVDVQAGRKHWRSTADGRDCCTLMLGDTVLPPGTERSAFHIHIEVTARGLGDYAFAISCGCRGGPGDAQKIVLPATLVDGAFAYYSSEHGGQVKEEDERQHIFFSDALRPRSAIP